MDRRESIAIIVKGNLKAEWSKEVYYPNIPNSVVSKIVKNFDLSINTNAIAAIVDTSIAFTNKQGLVFTLQGVYYKEFLEKPVFVNYADIDRMRVISHKKSDEELNITLNDRSSISIRYNTIDKYSLKRVLELLRKKSIDDNQVITKKSGVVINKVKIPDHIKKECHGIIHGAATLAGGVGTGLAQIPLADNAAITPIQIGMIISLGKVFGLRITEGIANGVIASCAATIAGRGITQVLWGWIPGVGNVINTATAAGVTEAIGWVAAKQFYLLQQDDIAKHRMGGMKAGYEAASAEYEVKLRDQARHFIAQQNVIKENLDAYTALCNEYLQHIIALESKLSKTEEENRKLREMKTEYENLVNCHVEEA